MRHIHPACLLLVALLGPACLIPTSLEAQSAPDGGQILMITGADPPFGTISLINKTDALSNVTVDVISDSEKVTGRLYQQLNGSCCELNLDKQPVTTRYLQEGDTSQVDVGTGTTGRYTIDFRQLIFPCNEAASGATLFIVPVVASQGFRNDGPNKGAPDGIGVTDRFHYWTVNCP